MSIDVPVGDKIEKGASFRVEVTFFSMGFGV
jgi:hypothetical protein